MDVRTLSFTYGDLSPHPSPFFPQLVVPHAGVGSSISPPSPAENLLLLASVNPFCGEYIPVRD